MNIGWVADFDFVGGFVGGAEMSDREAYVQGIKRGHEMSLIMVDNANRLSIEDFDLFVISNASKFSLDWMLKNICIKPYIMYLHDYWPLCMYRLFYPMQEKCRKCGSIPTVRQFVMNSALNIFLSPLHLDSWSFAIPEVKDHPYHLHPSPVNTELFKPLPNAKRNPNAGIVVNALEFKGFNNIVKYCSEHPEITFTFVGGLPQDAKLPPNCVAVGFVPPNKMPGMFAQANYYVELPASPQPFNRTVLEAKLMEVPHLVVNDLIGARSYDWFKEPAEAVRKIIKDAVPKWWEQVEKHI